MQRIDPIERELLTNRFRSLVLEMGELLRRTSLSTNIKERLDFSCGLLDADGNLIVNAPHIPVHLGALGLCVQMVTEVLPLESGECAISNHPAYGGSHLPDITLISPIDVEGVRVGYVASRAHHAEMGGRRPGSLEPSATTLHEEGVVISPMKLVEKGEVQWNRLRDVLTQAPHPTRSIEENLADLQAQLAANRKGTELLEGIAREKGTEYLKALMENILSDADQRMRGIWNMIPDQKLKAIEALDREGDQIALTVSIQQDSATFDFSGTSGIHPTNLNATPAIIQSAILYVLRVMANNETPPLPLNSGLLRSVTIAIPEQTCLNPARPADEFPAVMGGNVEISQRVVDTLLKAFNLAACSQGSMNNFVFGNDSFGVYETICGGTGATSETHGESAVHSHMTNTRITDPEVLEKRYPVRLKQFSIRKESGGNGVNRGGDGVVREVEFLAPLEVSFMGQHREVAPYGLNGGGNGRVGKQTLTTASGEAVEVSGHESFSVNSGDVLKIETPGGGGFGDA